MKEPKKTSAFGQWMNSSKIVHVWAFVLLGFGILELRGESRLSGVFCMTALLAVYVAMALKGAERRLDDAESRYWDEEDKSTRLRARVEALEAKIRELEKKG